MDRAVPLVSGPDGEAGYDRVLADALAQLRGGGGVLRRVVRSLWPARRRDRELPRNRGPRLRQRVGGTGRPDLGLGTAGGGGGDPGRQGAAPRRA